MSLRNIELQVALPRTVDAGKVQEQIMQKANIDQQQTAILLQQEQERNRIRSTPALPTTESVAIHQHHESNKQTNLKRKKKKASTEKEQPKEADHPYKGRFIDISL